MSTYPPLGRYPANESSPFRLFLIAMLIPFFAISAVLPGHAEESKPDAVLYRNVPIEPAEGLYLVTHDVNVRDRPDTQGEKLGLIEEGETVRVFGKAEGSWVAVKQEGRDLGFVYAPVLRRLFDGELDKDIRSRVILPGNRNCEYLVRYSGTSPVEGEEFETSDYEVGWRCAFGETAREFESFLFVSEAIQDNNDGRFYQVTLDIWEIGGGGDDQVFSTTTIYDREKGEVAFDSISLEDFASSVPPSSKPARNVADVLKAAVEICASSWNDKAWTAIESIAR